MQAFLAALVAIVLIAFGADVALNAMDFSSESTFSAPSVRLGQ